MVDEIEELRKKYTKAVELLDDAFWLISVANRFKVTGPLINRHKGEPAVEGKAVIDSMHLSNQIHDFFKSGGRKS